MLDRQHGRLVFECDACGQTLDTETREFNEALRMMRDASWRAQQVGGDWVHTCAGCADPNERNTRARRGGRIP